MQFVLPYFLELNFQKMKSPFFLLLAVFLISSCKTKPPMDLSELTTLIIRDFNKIKTNKKLIPLVINGKIDAEFCLKLEEKNLAKNKNERYAPPAPNPIKNEYITIDCNTFKEVLKNKQITKVEYEQLVAFIEEHEGDKQNMELAFGIDQDIEDLKKSKKENAYQEFGFPIVTDNLLVVYRNAYFGIKNHDKVPISASGQLLIYRKRNNKWALISRITDWSSK